MKLLVGIVVLLAITNAQANVISDIIGQVSSIFHTFEEAPYEVTRQAPGYQERKYPPRKWICVEELSNTSEVMESLFWRLFNYISGHNKIGKKIPMTVPVTTQYNVLVPERKNFRMCFFLGEEDQANPPEPIDSSIFIESRSQRTILTRTVGGYFETEDEWLDEAGKLSEILVKNAENFTLNGQYWAGYDPPLKFWNRRNEVWLNEI